MEMNYETTSASRSVDEPPSLLTTGEMCRWPCHRLSLSPRRPFVHPIRRRVWMFQRNDLYTDLGQLAFNLSVVDYRGICI